MKPRLYLETTIPSYLTAWPSRDVVILGHQETTREWWATCRERFELFVSALVVNEAAQGDAEAARLRLQALQDIPELAASPSAEALAAALLHEGAVPSGGDRCGAHRHCRSAWDGFPCHMKLPPHRQCRNGTAHPQGLRTPRLALPGHLHAGAICSHPIKETPHE